MKKAANVESVCKELGFKNVGFVEIKAGLVGFTVGHPDEVIMLAKRALDAGYGITRGLYDAVYAKTGGRFAIPVKRIKGGYEMYAPTLTPEEEDYYKKQEEQNSFAEYV